MKKGLVSIITPCYNAAKYISETIESVQSQIYSYWEMLIIDDGSIDNSSEIVMKYTISDDRIKYYKQSNAGSASARNNGIRRAEGQYIALLDADDVWKKNFLSEQIAFMEKNNTVCVYSSYSRIDENSREILRPTYAIEKITTRDMKVMNRIGCLTGLYDCSKYGKKYLDESLKSIRDDYAYWYDIVALENVAYGNIKILAKYRVLKNSTTGNKGKLIKKQFHFYRNYLNEGIFLSCLNIVKWGIAGIFKFYGN